MFGWVCGKCEYELDRFLVLYFTFSPRKPTADEIARVYFDAKRRGELPPPGPRGPGVNVRKPTPPGLQVVPKIRPNAHTDSIPS